MPLTGYGICRFHAAQCIHTPGPGGEVGNPWAELNTWRRRKSMSSAALRLLFAVLSVVSGARTSMHKAAELGQLEPLKVAVDGWWDAYEERRIKPDINGRNKKGQVALHLAVCNGAAVVDPVRVLLDKGADANARDAQSLTALHVAAGACPLVEQKFGEAKAAKLATSAGKLLLKHGAAMDAATDDGLTALHISAAGGKSFKLLLALLERGAPVNAADLKGATPLHHAVRSRNVREVEALIKAGADPSIKDVAGDVAGDALTAKDSTSVRMRNALENATEMRREAELAAKGTPKTEL